MFQDGDVLPDRPLSGIRVVDAVDGPLQTVGRVLADLGAEVLRIEAPGGSPARRSGVIHSGRSLTFLVRNAGKKSVVVDLTTQAGQAEFIALAASADVVLRDEPGPLAAAVLRGRNSRLVVVEMRDFGMTGPRSEWAATPDVHAALSTVLSRSGLPNVTEPLLPPEFLLYESAAVQAVWIVLLELAHVRATGQGDVADFSVQEALIQILDPVFGVGGSARAGVPLSDLPRGRPDARHLYPIFPARDGMVRICVLSKRQWQGMFMWLGEPAEFADPRYDNTMTRFAAADRLYPLIGEMFSRLSVTEAVEEGQRHGVPTAALASADGVIVQPAFRENGSFVETTVDGAAAVAHSGWFELDDVRLGARAGAPAVGESDVSPTHTPVAPLPDARPGRLPFEGLRVLDLGVIVVGAELGRLFADYGADVVKVESSAFPDGARQAPGGEAISESASWGMRNKRSLGLNLRSEDGKRVFADLVRHSDVVLTNFKPGTLASLGFGMDTLRSLNPGVILSESSAFGNHGSWSRRLGYGPLVRASAGLSALWSYPDKPDGYSDAITIFPDHVVARLNAAAIVALLLRRDRTGIGGRVSTAQVDAIFGAMADLLLAESLAPGTGPRPEGNGRGVFPGAGDDEWLVVDVRGYSAVVAKAIGHACAGPAELRGLLAEWSASRDPRAAAAELQAAGVPAGALLRADDLRADEHLRARRVFGELVQPRLPSPLIANLGEARTRTLPPPRLGPAPLAAEHTRQVLRDVLGLADDEIERLLDAGALEEHPAALAGRAGAAR